MLFNEAKEYLNQKGYCLIDEAATPDTIDLWGLKTVDKVDYSPTMWFRIIQNKKLVDDWIDKPNDNNPDFYVRKIISTVNTRRDRKMAWSVNPNEISRKLGITDIKKERYEKEEKCRKEYQVKCKEMTKKIAEQFDLILKDGELIYNDETLANSIIYFIPEYKVNEVDEFEWEPRLAYFKRRGYLDLSNSELGYGENAVQIPNWDIPEDSSDYSKSAWKNSQIRPDKETLDDIYNWIQENIDLVMEAAGHRRNQEEAILADQRRYYADHPNGNWSGD